jgi:L-threonylcarbamoyladenylate synthase
VVQVGTGEGVTAPGQLESHYAPSKPLTLNCVAPAPDQFHIGFGSGANHANLSAKGDLIEAAANLFAALHEADASMLPRISVAPISMEGIGAAINDRLKRAAA